ncbi:MAG TPA: hypothetical protein VK961_07630 [Chthoniobacter sp.]|nr:hypothetical protein [Chthoniobacter sp.]
MNTRFLTVTALVAVAASIAIAAEESNPIKEAMKFAHKAPQGEKKLNEKIVDGTAPEADVKKTLDLYKAMVDTKPPKGDQAGFKAKVEKLIAATEEVVEKKPDAIAHYKDAVNCKACHSEYKSAPPGK